MTYWQVSAGAEGRDYSHIFFDYGIMCVGGEQYIERIQNVSAGDIVVLKKGRSEVIGAGVIQEANGDVNHVDEMWLGDFEGWDLRDYVHVEWHRPEEPIQVDSGLAIGTLFELHEQEIYEIADNIIHNYPSIEPQPRPDFTNIERLEDSDIIGFLIQRGLRPGKAEELTNTFNRIRLLADFYYNHCNWYEVREHETRTFLIMPLLFALGWSEQKIKIELGTGERRRVDIACFTRPFTRTLNEENEYCSLLIESKGFSQGLDTAREQALVYAEAFPNCDKIIVSNGFCYKAFNRQGNEFSRIPSAYMNLLKPTNKHPLYLQSDGTLEIFEMLLP